MKIPQPLESGPPLIMVGPGTGIAAFRSFIQYCTLTNPNRKLVLIFGCRSECKDFYYADEWKEMKGSLKVITAFSRDTEDGSKMYV